MSGDMAEVSVAALTGSVAVSKRTQLKPEGYRTIDGKVIVEVELLHFLSVLPRPVVMLAVKAFDSEWIESSKHLFDLCPTPQRAFTEYSVNCKQGFVCCYR